MGMLHNISKVLAFMPALAASASVTCDALKGSGVSVEFDRFAIPKAPYAAELEEYWSKGCGDLKPACVVFPKTAEEMSTVIKALGTNNETFAIKSGGLSANPNWASVSGGVLISTRRLRDVTYDGEKNVVRVGTGNRWGDVQTALDPLGVTVAGARVGEVGVGGYMVGGGLSFLGAQHGWAVNTLEGVEMVLANGTVVTATATEHKDLFAAVKGGGNNYGVVTNYIMEAFPIGQVWGGMMAFTGGSQNADKMLSAIANFTASYEDHPEAGIIATVQLVLAGLIELWIVFFFYDGPTPPPGLFDEFLGIGPLLNLCKTRSYADLLTSNGAIVLRGMRYNVATETATLPPAVGAQKEVMRAYYDHWVATTKRYAGIGGLTSSMAIQPLPAILATEARRRGGDLLDLDADVDRIIFEYDLSYLFGWDDKLAYQAATEMTAGMKSLIDGHVEKGVTPKAFLPLFANDVFHGQDYFGRLRPEKRAFARDVAESVDPEGFFRTRTGGWKP